MMTWIDSQHWKFSTGLHNTAQIQHCPISMKFHIWVDLYIYICMYVQESNSLLCIAYVNVHLTRYDYNLTIMKSQVSQNQPLTTGLNNKSKATFEIEQCRESIRDIIIYPYIKFWWYRTMLNFCGHFENGCPELIPNIKKFLPVAIFKMATTIPQKFNIVRFQRNCICR
jgi:hypothetical protein